MVLQVVKELFPRAKLIRAQDAVVRPQRCVQFRLVIPVLDDIREKLSAILALQIRLNVILQVLQVVGPRAIQLPAHAARVVHLQHVPLVVVLQRQLVGEGFVALLAGEFVVVRRLQVEFAVLLQALLRHETVHTLVALVLGPTGHAVVLQRLTAHKDHGADLALVEGALLVDGRVVLQLALRQELLVALLATVLDNRLVVQVAMFDEHVVGVEDGTAVRTRELACARVSIPYVVHQIRLVHKELLALVAVKATTAREESPFSHFACIDLLRRVSASLVVVDLVHGAIVSGGEHLGTFIAGILLGGVTVFSEREDRGFNKIY